jgi:hypothetical protein
MGTNSKNSPSSERFFVNGSPSNKKHSSGTHQQQQRPTPSKSINIKTPNKNQSSNVAGHTNNSSSKRLSGSCSPPNFSFFAASKCFESPSAQSLPKPPTSWFNEGSKGAGALSKAPGKSQRVRKSLNLSIDNAGTSCAAEYAKLENNSFTTLSSNDHYTQNLKLLLNVTA